MGSISHLMQMQNHRNWNLEQNHQNENQQRLPLESTSSLETEAEEEKEKWRRQIALEEEESRKIKKSLMKNLSMDFCVNSSLHGLKYIGERRQHFVERMFWTFAFTTGMVVACIMISDVWKKYKSNSVIITFAPYETKIEEIPFPALTICNMNKILKSKAIKIMDDAKGFSGITKKSEALENLYYLNHVCSTSSSFSKVFNYSGERGKIDRSILNKANKNGESYDGGKEDLWNFFLEASPLCSDMILKCIWQKEIRNCSELFTPLETDNGKCCTFNMVPPSILHRFNMSGIREDPDVTGSWAWDGESLLKDRHFSENENLENYSEFPRRQKIPGQSFGLSILLNPGLEEYFCTSSDSHGFRMTTHLPIDVPHISDFGLAIRPNSEVFINIRPEVTIADKSSIGAFPPTQRECYFAGERNLSYYNFYTAKNCIDECLANLTYQKCNCRRHYQPGEESKSLCGPKDFNCASNIKREFVGTYKTKCKMCMPTCNEISYHAETTYTPLQSSDILWSRLPEIPETPEFEDMIKLRKRHNLEMAPWAGKNCSIVHIFFGEDSTHAKLRKELYGVIDLIANFGGLMGLCLGFSGLSLVEVIYFLTLRAWCHRWRRWKRDHHHRPDLSIGGLRRTETTTQFIDYDDEDDGGVSDDEIHVEKRARANIKHGRKSGGGNILREREEDSGYLEMSGVSTVSGGGSGMDAFGHILSPVSGESRNSLGGDRGQRPEQQPPQRKTFMGFTNNGATELFTCTV